MTETCAKCEGDGAETYEVEKPFGAVQSGGTVILRANEPVFLCRPVFTAKNGSTYVPHAISRFNMKDSEVKVILEPGIYAFCLDRGKSSIGKVVVVSEESSDIPEIELK